MEKYIYSADELIKTQPDVLKGLKFNKDDLTTINVNGVTIHADDYEMVYGRVFVIIKFYQRGILVASVSLFGSGEHKKDEVFVIDEISHLISETSLRVMKDTFERLSE